MKKLLLLSLLIIGCTASLPQPDVQVTTINDLTPLASINHIDDAQLALIIIQDFRVDTIKILRQRYPQRLEEIREADKLFQETWAVAHYHVTQWRLGEDAVGPFKHEYAALLNIAARYSQMRGGE